ncbi:unnamed protein product, partial [Laminaria digitata]
QTVEDGVFTITVVAGFVERVRIGDVDGTLNDTLGEVLRPITQSRPLNVRTLERYLLLANDLAGVQVTAVLRPSESTRGATVLEAKVRRTPYNAGASIDNRSSDFTGPWASSYSATANTPFGTGEKISLTVSEASGFSEKKAVAASYQQPLGFDGLRLDASVSYTESEPGSTLSEFEVETATTEFTSDLSYPVMRSRAQSLTVGAGFTYRDAAVDLLRQPFNEDRIRLFRVQGNYSISALFGGTARIILGATQSLQILDSTDPKTDSTSRGDADMDF